MHPSAAAAHVSQVIATWGYLGIFLCVFIGNLGFPVPEETVVLTAGFFAGRNLLDVRAVVAVVVLSAIAGDSTGYLIGRTGGQRLLDRMSRMSGFVRHRREHFEKFFHEHGTKAVFMARFVTGLRFMAGPMAGAAGMKFTRFLRWNVMGALSWCSLMVATGYLVGDEFDNIFPATAYVRQWILPAIAVVVLGFFVFWWRERHPASIGPDS
ncbi:MAG: DedA family protein [Candidatus Binatales bacterium]|jgi:membrane protein DedA with SNARE-associated domain